MQHWPGHPSPLGATFDGWGTNFALFSEAASSVDLCLFNEPGDATETHRIPILQHTHHVWHVYLPGIKPGQLYGYRVIGKYEPASGYRCNPQKLLLDPYARAIIGPLQYKTSIYGYVKGHPDADLSCSLEDSAGAVPKSLVIDPAFDWAQDRHPRTPWHQTIIYEAHVKGLTWQHPDIPPELRGTYAALAHPAIIKHLWSLGVTALELLPIHHFIDEPALIERGLTNYWGYNSIGFFAPMARYAQHGGGRHGEQVREFKTMVKELHKAGIEVILDVVYNHTAESGPDGPTLSFRGIDNKSYYRLQPDDPRRYLDYSGCGNTPNLVHPRTMQLVMDSLRYWLTEMHVDGFRFDLAPALARGANGGNRLSAFFDIVLQDPIISQAKLIAEPWDLGIDGYQVGGFPHLWAEWNGKYRDTVRRFWRGEPGQVPELALRITGSSDLYEAHGKRPYASINFVTCHDGFTLHDLVSFNDKHNEANGEQNRDGNNYNMNWNCGVEGLLAPPEVQGLREKMKRNYLVTLMLSQGVPMLCAGDEMSRTQQGNNNAYCQDNAISWINWQWSDSGKELHGFLRGLIHFYFAHPSLRRQQFYQKCEIHVGRAGLRWLRWDGVDLLEDDWRNPWTKCFGLLMDGECYHEVDEKGHPLRDDSMLILFSAVESDLPFHLPRHNEGGEWELVLDTRYPRLVEPRPRHAPLSIYPLESRSVAVFREVK
ncbi:MAG: glycogen debranching protein GlgX [Gemmatales bacterium]